MNYSKYQPSPWRAMIAAGLVVACLSDGRAQNNGQSKNPPATSGIPSSGGIGGVTPNGIGNGVIGKPGDVDIHQILSDAKILVKGNDLSGAELKLTASNATAANTASWHQETSQKLLQLAESFSHDGDKTNAATVVTQTLQHLDSAATLAQSKSDFVGVASAKALAGFVHERYRGDTASAIASYQAALVATPKSKAIQEQLERLQRADALLRARIQAKR